LWYVAIIQLLDDDRPLRVEVQPFWLVPRHGLTFIELDSPWRSTTEARGGAEAETALNSGEAEVLRLLSEGLGNLEIATKLSISESTVESRIATVLGKLGALREVEA